MPTSTQRKLRIRQKVPSERCSLRDDVGIVPYASFEGFRVKESFVRFYTADKKALAVREQAYYNKFAICRFPANKQK